MMFGVVLRRLAFSAFSLVVVSLLLFVLTRSIADSPARIVLGDQASEQQIAQFDRDHGLDRSIVVQYVTWISRLVLHGDLGRSFATGLDMNRQIRNTLPVTMEIVGIAFLTASIWSRGLGMLSALWRDGPIGLVAGFYSGGWFEQAAMRILEAVSAIPILIWGIA